MITEKFINTKTLVEYSATNFNQPMQILRSKTKADKLFFAIGSKRGYVAKAVAEDIFSNGKPNGALNVSDILNEETGEYITTLHYQGEGTEVLCIL